MKSPSTLPEHKSVAAFFLLPSCDIRCVFCISHDDFDVVKPEEARGLIDFLASQSVKSVVLGGGEPTLWPHDVNELARYASEAGLVTQLNTHGAGVRENLDKYSHVDRFILPVESTRSDVHDDLRRGLEGHHSMVMDLADELIARGRELTFATVVTSKNHMDVPAIASWIHGLLKRGAKVHSWHLYNFLPEGRGGARKIAEGLATTREQFLTACSSAKGAGLGFPVYRRDNMLKSSTVEFFWFEEGELHIGGEELARAAH
jgi:MoaA/NifB/PqqE/SkfB family radical SAM enzyme